MRRGLSQKVAYVSKNLKKKIEVQYVSHIYYNCINNHRKCNYESSLAKLQTGPSQNDTARIRSVNFGPRNFTGFQLKQTLTRDSHFVRSHDAILPAYPKVITPTSEFCYSNASDAPQRPRYSQEIASTCPYKNV